MSTADSSTADEKTTQNPFEEFMWMEKEEEVTQEFEAEVVQEEIQELELNEMLEEEEENREGASLAKASSPVVNGDVSEKVTISETDRCFLTAEGGREL